MVTRGRYRADAVDTVDTAVVDAVRVRSGWFFPSGGESVDDWLAARVFPPLDGWVVVLAHGDGAGGVMVGGRRLTDGEFAGRVRHVAGAAERVLLMVCGGAIGLAERVRAEVGCDVLAADGAVWQSRWGVHAEVPGAWRWFGPSNPVTLAPGLARALAAITPGCGERRLGGMGVGRPVAWVVATSAHAFLPNAAQVSVLKRLHLVPETTQKGFAQALLGQASTGLSVSTSDGVYTELAKGFAGAYARHHGTYDTLWPKHDDGTPWQADQIGPALLDESKRGAVAGLLPWLAADVFDLRVTVVFDDGDVVTVGPATGREVIVMPTSNPVGGYVGLASTSGNYKAPSLSKDVQPLPQHALASVTDAVVATKPTAGIPADWVNVDGIFSSKTDTVMFTELRKFGSSGSETKATRVLSVDELADHVQGLPGWNSRPVVFSVAGGVSAAKQLATSLKVDVLAAEHDTSAPNMPGNRPSWLHIRANGSAPTRHNADLAAAITAIKGKRTAPATGSSVAGSSVAGPSVAPPTVTAQAHDLVAAVLADPSATGDWWANLLARDAHLEKREPNTSKVPLDLYGDGNIAGVRVRVADAYIALRKDVETLTGSVPPDTRTDLRDLEDMVRALGNSPERVWLAKRQLDLRAPASTGKGKASPATAGSTSKSAKPAKPASATVPATGDPLGVSGPVVASTAATTAAAGAGGAGGGGGSSASSDSSSDHVADRELPPFLTEGVLGSTDLAGFADGTVAGLLAKVTQLLPNRKGRDNAIASIGKKINGEPRSLFDTRRRFAVRIGAEDFTVVVSAVLDTAQTTWVDPEENEPQVEVERTQTIANSSVMGRSKPTTVGIGGSIGQSIGASGSFSVKAPLSNAPTKSVTSGMTIGGGGKVAGEGDVAKARMPVTFTVDVVDGNGRSVPDPNPEVNGEVDLYVPAHLHTLENAPAGAFEAINQAALSTANTWVPEAFVPTVHDPVLTVSSNIPASEEDLNRFLGADNFAQNLPSLVAGELRSALMNAPHGKSDMVSASLTVRSGRVVGVANVKLTNKKEITDGMAQSASAKAGMGVSIGAGGGAGTTPVGGSATVTVTATGEVGSSAGSGGKRTTKLEMSSTDAQPAALVKLFTTVQVRTENTEPVQYGAWAYVWMAPAQARDLGLTVPTQVGSLAVPVEPVIEPPDPGKERYMLTTEVGSLGPYYPLKFLTKTAMEDFRTQLLTTLRSEAIGFQDGFAELTDGTSLPTRQQQNILRNLAILDATLDELPYRLNDLPSMNFTRQTKTHDVYLEVQFEIDRNEMTHLGEVKRTMKVTEEGSVDLKTGKSKALSITGSVDGKFMPTIDSGGVPVNPGILGAGMAITGTWSRNSSAGPTPKHGTAHKSSSNSQAFETSLTLSVTLAEYRVPRNWVRSVTLGLPGSQSPTVERDFGGVAMPSVTDTISVAVPGDLTTATQPTPSPAPQIRVRTLAAVPTLAELAGPDYSGSEVPVEIVAVSSKLAATVMDEATSMLSTVSRDNALTLPDTQAQRLHNRLSSRTMLDPAINSLPPVEKMFTRRTGDSTASIQPAYKLTDLQLVPNAEVNTTVDRTAAGGYSLTSSEVTRGVTVDANFTFGFGVKLLHWLGLFPGSSGKAKSWSSSATEGMSSSVSVKRGQKAGKSPTGHVYVTATMTVTVTAASRWKSLWNMLRWFPERTAAKQVSQDNAVLGLISVADAQRAGLIGTDPTLLPKTPHAELPDPTGQDNKLHLPATVDGEAWSPLGIGKLEQADQIAAELRELVKDLAETPNVLKLFGEHPTDDEPANLARLLGLIEPRTIEAMVNSLGSGVAVHLFELSTFSADAVRLRLSATTDQTPRFTELDASVGETSVATTVETSTTTSASQTTSSAPGASAPDKFSPVAGPHLAPTVGVSAGTGTGVGATGSTTRTQSRSVVYTATSTGPVARFTIPNVTFALSVEMGNAALGEVRTNPMDVSLSVLADDLRTDPDPTMPPPAMSLTTTSPEHARQLVAAWQADTGGTTLPPGPASTPSTTPLRNTVFAALTHSGAPGSFTKAGGHAALQVWSATTPEWISANLPSLLGPDGARLPSLYQTAAFAGMTGQVQLYGRFRNVTLHTVSPKTKVSITQGAGSTGDRELQRDNSSNLTTTLGPVNFRDPTSPNLSSGLDSISFNRGAGLSEKENTSATRDRSVTTTYEGTSARIEFTLDVLAVVNVRSGVANPVPSTTLGEMSLPGVTLRLPENTVQDMLGQFPDSLVAATTELATATTELADATKAMLKARTELEKVQTEYASKEHKGDTPDSDAAFEPFQHQTELQDYVTARDDTQLAADTAKNRWWLAKKNLDQEIAGYNVTAYHTEQWHKLGPQRQAETLIELADDAVNQPGQDATWWSAVQRFAAERTIGRDNANAPGAVAARSTAWQRYKQAKHDVATAKAGLTASRRATPASALPGVPGAMELTPVSTAALRRLQDAEGALALAGAEMLRVGLAPPVLDAVLTQLATHHVTGQHRPTPSQLRWLSAQPSPVDTGAVGSLLDAALAFVNLPWAALLAAHGVAPGNPDHLTSDDLGNLLAEYVRATRVSHPNAYRNLLGPNPDAAIDGLINHLRAGATATDEQAALVPVLLASLVASQQPGTGIAIVTELGEVVAVPRFATTDGIEHAPVTTTQFLLRTTETPPNYLPVLPVDRRTAAAPTPVAVATAAHPPIGWLRDPHHQDEIDQIVGEFWRAMAQRTMPGTAGSSAPIVAPVGELGLGRPMRTEERHAVVQMQQAGLVVDAALKQFRTSGTGLAGLTALVLALDAAMTVQTAGTSGGVNTDQWLAAAAAHRVGQDPFAGERETAWDALLNAVMAADDPTLTPAQASAAAKAVAEAMERVMELGNSPVRLLAAYRLLTDPAGAPLLGIGAGFEAKIDALNMGTKVRSVIRQYSGKHTGVASDWERMWHQVLEADAYDQAGDDHVAAQVNFAARMDGWREYQTRLSEGSTQDAAKQALHDHGLNADQLVDLHALLRRQYPVGGLPGGAPHDHLALATEVLGAASHADVHAVATLADYVGQELALPGTLSSAEFRRLAGDLFIGSPGVVLDNEALLKLGRSVQVWNTLGFEGYPESPDQVIMLDVINDLVRAHAGIVEKSTVSAKDLESLLAHQFPKILPERRPTELFNMVVLDDALQRSRTMATSDIITLAAIDFFVRDHVNILDKRPLTHEDVTEVLDAMFGPAAPDDDIRGDQLFSIVWAYGDATGDGLPTMLNLRDWVAEKLSIPGNVHFTQAHFRAMHVLLEPEGANTAAGVGTGSGDRITFDVARVESNPLYDAHGNLIGLSFSPNPEDIKGAQGWIGGAVRLADTQYTSVDPKPDPRDPNKVVYNRHPSRSAPWKNAGTPVYVLAHADKDNFYLDVNVGTPIEKIWVNVRLDGATYARLLSGNHHFQQAAGADPTKPLVLVSCEAGRRASGSAAEQAAAFLHGQGHLRSVYGSTGYVTAWGKGELFVHNGVDKAGKPVPGRFRGFSPQGETTAAPGPVTKPTGTRVTVGANQIMGGPADTQRKPPKVAYLAVPSVGSSATDSVRKWLLAQDKTVTAYEKLTPGVGSVLVEVLGDLIDAPSPGGGWSVSTAKLRALDVAASKPANRAPRRSNLDANPRGAADLGPRDATPTVRFRTSNKAAEKPRFLASTTRTTQKNSTDRPVFAGKMSQADRVRATFGLPRWQGVRTVAGVHTAQGKLISGGVEYTVAQFAKRFGGRAGIVALVSSGAAAQSEGNSYAAELAKALEQPVVAAASTVVQLPDGRIITGTVIGAGTNDPKISTARGTGWQLFQPDGTSEYLNQFDFAKAVEQVLKEDGIRPDDVRSTSKAAGFTSPVVWAESKDSAASEATVGNGSEWAVSLASFANHQPVGTSPASTLLAALPVEQAPGAGVLLDSGEVYFASGVEEEDVVAAMAVRAWQADFGDQFEPVYVHADPVADGVQTTSGFMTNAEFATWFRQTQPQSTKRILLIMCGGAHVKNAGNKSVGELLAKETGRGVLTVGGVLWQTEDGVRPVPFETELLQQAALHEPPTDPVSADLEQKWGWVYFSPESEPKLLGHDLSAAITGLGLKPPTSLASPDLVTPVAWVRSA